MFASLGTAHAVTVTYDALPSNASYFAPQATSSTGSYFQGVTGSDSTRTSPFYDTSTFYDSVGADGTATFGMALPTEEKSAAKVFQLAAFSNGPSSSGFGMGNDTFSFVWGTPDSYNNLYFYDNGVLTNTVNGSGSPTSGNGTNSYLATVSGLGAYNTVVFQSVGKNAFEFAAVSPVPLPASLPMFGAAVLALGGLSFALRGRRASLAG